MQVQHDKNVRDLRDLLQRAEKAQRTAHQPEGADEAVTLPMLDARFEWLVKELSDRLVILGNEIARLDRQLASPGTGNAGSTVGRTVGTYQRRRGRPDLDTPSADRPPPEC
jgi:uncharacterized small protein (DUF1192 family)